MDSRADGPSARDEASTFVRGVREAERRFGEFSNRSLLRDTVGFLLDSLIPPGSGWGASTKHALAAEYSTLVKPWLDGLEGNGAPLEAREAFLLPPEEVLEGCRSRGVVESQPRRPSEEFGSNPLHIPVLPPLPPVVDLSRKVDGQRSRLDTSHLRLGEEGNVLKLPLMLEFETIKFAHFGNRYQAVLFDEILAMGKVAYKYLVYVVDLDQDQPCLVIAAETSETTEREGISPFLCVVRPGGRTNLGSNSACDSIDSFFQTALALAVTEVGCSATSASVASSTRSDLERIDRKTAKLVRYGNAAVGVRILEEAIPRIAGSVFRSIDQSMKFTLANGFMALNRMGEASQLFEEILAVEAARGNADNISNVVRQLAVCALAHSDLERMEENARLALEIRLTPGHRWQLTGFALHSENHSPEHAEELFLLGLVAVHNGASALALGYLELAAEMALSFNNYALVGAARLALVTTRLGAGALREAAGLFESAARVIGLMGSSENMARFFALASLVATQLTQSERLEWKSLLGYEEHSGEPKVGNDVAQPAPPASAHQSDTEAELIQQLCQVSESIVAGLILTNEPLPVSTWEVLAKNSQSAALSSFQSSEAYNAEFGRRLARGSISPILIDEIHETRVDLPSSGRVYLSDAHAINEALIGAGSDVRFVYLGQARSWAHRAIGLAGLDHAAPSADPRFLVGRVGPCSATPFARLFHFTEDLVVSPFLLDDAPGFNHGTTIVIREAVLDGYSLDKRERLLDHILVHETGHVLGGSGLRPYGFAPVGWRLATLRDVERQVEGGATALEIRRALRWNFSHPGKMLDPDAVDGERKVSGIDLRAMLDEQDLEVFLKAIDTARRIAGSDATGDEAVT